MALLLPPLRGRERRCPSLDIAGEGERRPTDLRVGPAGLDPDVDVNPARAGRLRPADEPNGLERLAADHRDLADLRPLDARDRVEIDPQLVGVVEILGPNRMGVEVDAAEIGDPGEPGRLAQDDLVGGSSGRKRQLGRVDPVRSVFGRSLLEERLALSAVDEAFEGHRPTGDAAQRTVGDREVVVDQVHLGVAGLGEVDLVRVRHRDFSAAALEDFLAGRHAQHDTAVRPSSARPGPPNPQCLGHPLLLPPAKAGLADALAPRRAAVVKGGVSVHAQIVDLAAARGARCRPNRLSKPQNAGGDSTRGHRWPGG